MPRHQIDEPAESASPSLDEFPLGDGGQDCRGERHTGAKQIPLESFSTTQCSRVQQLSERKCNTRRYSVVSPGAVTLINYKGGRELVKQSQTKKKGLIPRIPECVNTDILLVIPELKSHVAVSGNNCSYWQQRFDSELSAEHQDNILLLMN